MSDVRSAVEMAAFRRRFLFSSHLSFYARTFTSSSVCYRSAVPEEFETDGDVWTVEEQYSRKTPLEHVLLRPGMYVGPAERLPPTTCWVLEKTPTPPSKESDINTMPLQMIRREYGLVPALSKVFDEILVNAADNRLRDPQKCTRVDVIIDPGNTKEGKEPFISVYNNGKGIPIQIHKKEKMHVPELLFGHLLTGSNFDDDRKRLTGGRHGYGAKLTNIFSKTFTVETADAKKGLLYRQTWCDNMSICTPPEIVNDDTIEEDFTRVSYVPDLVKLIKNEKAESIPHDDYAIMCKRVVDIAGCASGKIEVTLNGRSVPVNGFEDFVQLHRQNNSPSVCFQKVNSRWEVGIGLSDSGSFESVSFVNSMATNRGGTHVNVIVQQVIKRIAERVNKLFPELKDEVSHASVKRNLAVFCNALIENPSFDSQSKESLTSNPSSFGSHCVLSERFIKQMLKDQNDGGPGIVEEVARAALGRQQALLKGLVSAKKANRHLNIPKLDDAHQAGTEKGRQCTLILTEGDSAKALAVAGLEVIGREFFGVFPLKGKFLNVRHASVTQLAKNQELKSLCSILGLEFDKKYATRAERDELRYGHVMLMTDQDTDGSHIKGLMMNFFRHFWPNLLQPAVDDEETRLFLSSFLTPLLKATKKGSKETISFYSMADYNDWQQSLGESDGVKKWKVKYYKGLGTSTPSEAKEYFSAFSNHKRQFRWDSDKDGELLDMVFDQSRAADRRQWILDEYDESASLPKEPVIKYEDFVNKEMIHFSNADNLRSIPSVVDGLKPSQRKVLYSCFKRNLKNEIKVAQLTGYVAEHACYHHGEASLHSTIIGMAQDFVGSNNLNLLEPSGQFGTRLAGGKDAASPRYIFTRLSPVARLLFPEVDDILLTHREDDGQVIEPEYYCPIIPLLLVNGSQGIGTGWSTFIPSYNPIDVLDYVRSRLNRTDLPVIRPWVRGFKGRIDPNKDGNGFFSVGNIKRVSSKSVEITELPIGCWTSDYKSHLLKLREKREIQSFVENHTTTSVSFTIFLSPVQLKRMEKSGLEKVFKLKRNLLTSNMNAFSSYNVMTNFESAEGIVESFFPTRLSLYHDRKAVLESNMSYMAKMKRNKAKFISEVTNGNIDLVSGRKSKEHIVSTLRDLGFATTSELRAIRNKNTLGNVKSSDLGNLEETQNSSPMTDFDYLLSLPLSSLTVEMIDALQQEAHKMEEEHAAMAAISPEMLWLTDLDKLETHLRKGDVFEIIN